MPLPAAPTKRADTLTGNGRASGVSKAHRTRRMTEQEHPAGHPGIDAGGMAGGGSAVLERTDIVPRIPSAPQQRHPGPRQNPPRKTARPGQAKLFVLDTNVLMHDPMSIFSFADNDVFLPMMVLEELDNHKKGLTDVARNVRQISRTLDELLRMPASDNGIPLDCTGYAEARGQLFLQTEMLDTTLPQGLPDGKADNKILAVVQALRAKHSQRDVVLVSNDINMRIKAKALGLVAQVYTNDKALDDTELLYRGHMALPGNFWETMGPGVESRKDREHTVYGIHSPLAAQMLVNEFLYLDGQATPPFLARVTAVRGTHAEFRTIRDYSISKNAVLGVTARNREQNFALNLLMDPNVDFVTLAGKAGSGKTLLALAAGLSQVLDDRRYTEIIMTRVTVPVGEDIGFLPGSEEEKMGPWMGALDDNLEVLGSVDRTGGAGEWGRAHQSEQLRSKVKIKSLNFMRGRTFLNKFVIIDEAQNLTPKQMKTLITRAGPGTKIVCMGNLEQIDTPYLTEGSSGFTFAVDRFKGWRHGGHVTLQRGERSRLADFASEVL